MEAVKNIAQKVTGDAPAGVTNAADVSGDTCRFKRPIGCRPSTMFVPSLTA